MGTISGMTHFKAIFCFSPGTGKYFVSTTYIKKKVREYNLENKWPMELGPVFLSNDQETP
jgi:hypothetical protein